MYHKVCYNEKIYLVITRRAWFNGSKERVRQRGRCMTTRQDALIELRAARHDLEASPAVDVSILRTAVQGVVRWLNTPARREALARNAIATKAIEALPEVQGYPMDIRIARLQVNRRIWEYETDPQTRSDDATEEGVNRLKQNSTAAARILDWYERGARRNTEYPDMTGLSQIVSGMLDFYVSPPPHIDGPGPNLDHVPKVTKAILHLLDSDFPLEAGQTWEEYLKALLEEEGNSRIAAINSYTPPMLNY